ncbi:Ferredoxin-dependent glutamate synthase, chloroplastic [Dendrobium catenatum]|uniref:Ferredoxin-dependent glutamate synthase, chloroplastic n=1 Tax=Dendrobium catenatum TaxID=906689 RepID=A0A2I0VYV8_9ASPA|nr:Ferredoxin-dependent glutamate synthase, chloroplastic [Dendrobium catenatum]
MSERRIQWSLIGASALFGSLSTIAVLNLFSSKDLSILPISAGPGAFSGISEYLGLYLPTQEKICKMKFSGVPFISPPPQCDIYSIEDFAQLIFNLHQVNPKAKVSVKLGVVAGIGTVASGVVKANVDIIQIFGHN